MGISDTLETGLSLVQRIWEVGYYGIAVLIGFFMVLWGIFFNGWDWLLIGAGLAVALIAGWYTYREIIRTKTG
jgi:hypothetical protein